MKPKPFASLNHFTVPCSILIVFPGLNCAGGIGATTGRILLVGASTAAALFGSNAGASVPLLSIAGPILLAFSPGTVPFRQLILKQRIEIGTRAGFRGRPLFRLRTAPFHAPQIQW